MWRRKETWRAAWRDALVKTWRQKRDVKSGVTWRAREREREETKRVRLTVISTEIREFYYSSRLWKNKLQLPVNGKFSSKIHTSESYFNLLVTELSLKDKAFAKDLSQIEKRIGNKGIPKDIPRRTKMNTESDIPFRQNCISTSEYVVTLLCFQKRLQKKEWDTVVAGAVKQEISPLHQFHCHRSWDSLFTIHNLLDYIHR